MRFVGEGKINPGIKIKVEIGQSVKVVILSVIVLIDLAILGRWNIRPRGGPNLNLKSVFFSGFLDGGLGFGTD